MIWMLSGGIDSASAPSFTASPSMSSIERPPDASTRELTDAMRSACSDASACNGGDCPTRAWPPENQNTAAASPRPAVQKGGPPRAENNGTRWTGCLRSIAMPGADAPSGFGIPKADDAAVSPSATLPSVSNSASTKSKWG
jgi:hypothetical protein